MRDYVFVSILMPAYNAEATIRDSIGSVVRQTHAQWELVVVNDGSSDATPKIAREFALNDSRIRVVDREQGGESAARNTALAEARYDWVLFLDSDDWIAESHLQKLTAVLAANPAMDAVICGSTRVIEDGTLIEESYLPSPGDLFPTLARRAAFPVHACLFRRARAESIGPFDVTLRKSADWDFWQRYARTGARFAVLPEVLAFYRVTRNSSSMSAIELFEDGLTVLRRGHSSDPRVRNPLPAYRNGLPQATVESQQYYLLCWSAGLMLGAGQDPRVLLERVPGQEYRYLYANAVAKCLFEAAILPASLPWEAWPVMWQKTRPMVEQFLAVLEAHTKTPKLAANALLELKKLVLLHWSDWQDVVKGQATEIEELRDVCKRLDAYRIDLEAALQRQEAAGAEHARESSARNQQLQASHDVLQADALEASRRYESTREELASVRKEKEELAAHVTALHSQLAAVQLDLDRAQADSAGLRDKLELREQDSRAFQAEIGVLQSDLANVRGENSSLKTALATLLQDLEQRERFIDGLRQEIHDEALRFDSLLRLSGDLGDELATLKATRWTRLGKNLRMLPAEPPASPPASFLPARESGWTLRLVDASTATLLLNQANAAHLRLSIRRVAAGASVSDIQVNLPAPAVHAGRTYRASFLARSDSPRTLGIGVAMASEPWQNVGLYDVISLQRDWKSFSWSFVATVSAASVRAHFDAGGSQVAFEWQNLMCVEAGADQ